MSVPPDGRGKIAALDCGTNTTRVMIADSTGRCLERIMTITRLGKGVDRTGELDREAIDRTVDALTRYRTVMDFHGVERARCAATSAVRDARNSSEFFVRARAATGVMPEILTGREEGGLAFLGATSELDPCGSPCLVVDIGGGSTEFVAGVPGSEPGFVESTDMGCVRITERFLHDDPPSPESVAQAAAEVRRILDGVAANAAGYGSFAGHRLVGLAGTVTTLVAMSLGLDRYDRDAIHHSVLTASEARRIADELCAETVAQRLHHRGLEPGRADVIAAGGLILATTMEFLGFSECLVSEADILDGLVASQMA